MSRVRACLRDREERTSLLSSTFDGEKSRDSAADVTAAPSPKSKSRAVSLDQSEAIVEAHTRQQARVSAARKHVFAQRCGYRTEQNPRRSPPPRTSSSPCVSQKPVGPNRTGAERTAGLPLSGVAQQQQLVEVPSVT